MIRSIKRIVVLADKEWIQIKRDARSLILSIFLPAFLILLFGYALSVDVKHVKTGILNLDKGHLSRQYIEKFRHTEYIDIVKFIDSHKEIDRLIDSGKIVMAVVIPPDFEKKFRAGKNTDIQLLTDGSDSTSASISIAYVKAITEEFNADLLKKKSSELGLSSAKTSVIIQGRIMYNPELRSKNFIIPGLAVLILAIISALITSLTISREWERGTMESLITTPVRKFEIVFGKLLPYLLIGVFDVVLSISVGNIFFDVPFKGSFFLLCLISLLFLIGTSSIGILISSATRVQVLSVQLAIVATYLPTFILSDYIFPIKNMPIVIKGITYLIPAKYMVYVAKGLALKGIGYHLLITQIGFLGIFAVIVLSLSIKKLSLMLPEN